MTTRREIRISISLSALVLFLCTTPLFAEALVLDLDGDGLRLSDRYYPVSFDLDGDGQDEVLSWTAGRQNEAFLWRDVDGDGLPGAGELLTGFGQLRRWDRATFGGNGDGVLTERDRLWSELRLWIDRDHDGLAAEEEVSRPGDWGLFEIGLATAGTDATVAADAPVEIDGGLTCSPAAARAAAGTRTAPVTWSGKRRWWRWSSTVARRRERPRGRRGRGGPNLHSAGHRRCRIGCPRCWSPGSSDQRKAEGP